MIADIYDVAIIGAGPAGSTLAYRLASSGIRTCIIDKETFPRKKVCAGGLPPKVIDIVPFSISPIIRNEVLSVSLSYKTEKTFHRSYPLPLLYTVDREMFDDFLLRKAVDAGAVFRENEQVERISLAAHLHSITARKEEVRARIIVGADGANSITARSIGINPVDARHVALQVEVPLEKIRTASPVGQTIFLDWGLLKDGYGWLFPNGDFVSIGLMGPLKQGRAVKTCFRRWVEFFGLDVNDFHLRAHNIPHRISERPVTAGRALLVGDAAGLGDFWTGEGIYHAVRSADMAARQIIRFLRGETAAIKEYETLINRAILPELSASYLFSRIFNYSSPVAYGLIERYSYPWEVFCRIIRGDRSFSEIRKRLRPDIFMQKLIFKSKRNK